MCVCVCVCAVDLGEEKPRTVCSGLTKFVPLEQMQVCSVGGYIVVVRPWESGMRCMVECHFPTV